MKLSRVTWIGLILALLSFGVSGCSTSGTGASSGNLPGIYAPSPMAQQMRMQEAQSRVMRSLVPF